MEQNNEQTLPQLREDQAFIWERGERNVIDKATALLTWSEVYCIAVINSCNRALKPDKDYVSIPMEGATVENCNKLITIANYVLDEKYPKSNL